MAGGYLAVYVALDRASAVHALSDVGFTLWNPPPACSLALLLICGLGLAPLVLVAGILADCVNGGFADGVWPALAADAIVAAGYTGVAALLQGVAHGRRMFQTLRDVTAFLIISGIGVLAIGSIVAGAMAAVQQAQADRLLSFIRHFWVGDITGIVGLLPVLLTAPRAWIHWKEVPARSRLVDIATFAGGLAIALWVVFGIADAREFQFFYLLLLPVIWIAVRHGLPWCAVAILAEQVALVTLVVRLEYPAPDFITFQILSLAIALTGLVLGAAVSERQRAERSLRQHQVELTRMARLATAGALGSAIIHEMSQPLASIATYAHVCRRVLRSRPEQVGLLEDTTAKLEAEVLRAGTIIERLRDFLSRGNLLVSRVDLAELARRVVANLSGEARLRDVDVQLRALPAWCVADPVQIELVLVNLIRNAIDAAAVRGPRQRHVRIRVHQATGRVEVEVEDSGPGVSPEIAARLFEPFTTDKPRGIGLGLLLSRQIIEAHGGELWWDMLAPAGTRFAFRLPDQGPDQDER